MTSDQKYLTLTIITKLNAENPIIYDGKKYLVLESKCYNNFLQYKKNFLFNNRLNEFTNFISVNTKQVDKIYSDSGICLTNLLEKIYSGNKKFICREFVNYCNAILEPENLYHNGVITKNYGLLSDDNKYIISGLFNGTSFIPDKTNIYLENNTPIVMRSETKNILHFNGIVNSIT